MTLFDLILIAVSLSMDAFAVSICKGLSVRKVSLAHALTCGVWFGGFQFLMPTLGYFLGDRFATLLTKFGPWVAFVLLALIGANMVKESFGGDEQLDDDYSAKAAGYCHQHRCFCRRRQLCRYAGRYHFVRCAHRHHHLPAVCHRREGRCPVRRQVPCSG